MLTLLSSCTPLLFSDVPQHQALPGRYLFACVQVEFYSKNGWKCCIVQLPLVFFLCGDLKLKRVCNSAYQWFYANILIMKFSKPNFRFCVEHQLVLCCNSTVGFWFQIRIHTQLFILGENILKLINLSKSNCWK